MKRLYKQLALLLAVCLVFLCMPVRAFARTTEEDSFACGGVVAQTYLSGGVYFDDLEEAAAALREAMKKRQDSVPIKFKTKENWTYKEAAKAIWAAAMVHTGEPTEGDYLLKQWGPMNYTAGYYSNRGTNYFEFTYKVNYYTSAQQEQEVDAAVAQLLTQLDLEGKSDYEKICAVYLWMCSNIKYDYANLNNRDYMLKHAAYAALINRTAVCQGYALLFYRLMLELGIDCRIVTGVANGGAHAWNIVLLDGKYYNVDATWDAVWYESGDEYEFFLQCDENFEDHRRDAEYDTAEFRAEYPMSATDYDPNAAPDTEPDGGEEKHSYQAAVTEPTCTKGGYTTYTCSICGGSYVDNETDPLGHSPAEAVKENETASGHDEVVYCAVCGEELSREFVKTYSAGDINGDGSVNNKDVTRLFQHLSGWSVEVNEAALDVNGDGSVNNKDVTRLFQYLSGWAVEIH